MSLGFHEPMSRHKYHMMDAWMLFHIHHRIWRERCFISLNYTEGFNSQKLKVSELLVPFSTKGFHWTAGPLGLSVNQDAPLETKYAGSLEDKFFRNPNCDKPWTFAVNHPTFFPLCLYLKLCKFPTKKTLINLHCCVAFIIWFHCKENKMQSYSIADLTVFTKQKWLVMESFFAKWHFHRRLYWTEIAVDVKCFWFRAEHWLK